MGRYYTDFADFLAEHFPGKKMQKLTVDAGFSCPNRDGTISHGGCAYCNNSSFSPALQGGSHDVSRQLEAGKIFFAKKYPTMRYLAYFQSYTNTHGQLNKLLSLYDEALSHPDIDGLIIGTRPDCLSPQLLEALAQRRADGKWIMIELGAESSFDETLTRINRGHDWQTTVDAVTRIKQAGLPVGLHLIMGLPGESVEMMLTTAEEAANLHPDSVKFHQLQIIKGSKFGTDWLSNPDHGSAADVTLFTPELYLNLCVEIIKRFNRISPSTALERFTSSAPPELLIAPRWGMKNYQFVNLLHNRLAKDI